MDPVANTAAGVARVRELESARPDRIFEDPFAGMFVAAQTDLPPLPTNPNPQMVAMLRGLVIRTRFFDEMLVEAAETCGQIVLLGAGFDARAFRFRWPEGTRLFELDRLDMLSWKNSVLDQARAEPTCERITVPTDLSMDWPVALARAGHDAKAPTAWLAEGLLVYLDAPVVEGLLEQVTLRSPLGSRLGLSIGRSGRAAPTAALNKLWVSRAPADPKPWLRGHGWDPTFHARGELATRFGRPEWAYLEGSVLVDARRLPPE
jgi:methyltransferase (TIGR00027 family)